MIPTQLEVVADPLLTLHMADTMIVLEAVADPLADSTIWQSP